MFKPPDYGPGDARWPWLAERENLQREVETSTHKAGALMSRLDELQRELAKTVRERDETVGALTGRLDELQRELAKTVHERDEMQYDLGNALSQLAELKRSRLLKVGRLLRRIAGLPMPY